jgi:hypothetical protein
MDHLLLEHFQLLAKLVMEFLESLNVALEPQPLSLVGLAGNTYQLAVEFHLNVGVRRELEIEIGFRHRWPPKGIWQCSNNDKSGALSLI